MGRNYYLENYLSQSFCSSHANWSWWGQEPYFGFTRSKVKVTKRFPLIILWTIHHTAFIFNILISLGTNMTCIEFTRSKIKGSGWAIVTGLCPSCVVLKLFYLNIFSETPHWMWPNFTGMIPGWSPTKVVQTVLIVCISRSWGQKIGFQNAISKVFLSETTRPRAFVFGI